MRELGFVEEGDLQASSHIVGSKEEKLMLSTGDQAYVEFPENRPLHVGERYTVYKIEREVQHPVTHARVGYVVQPSTLLYVKGGGGWVRDNVWFTANGTTVTNDIITPTGWTIGAGVEFLFFNNWSVFAEYNYLSFGNSQTALINPATGVTPVNFNHNVQTLLIGLNYRFSGPLSPSW